MADISTYQPDGFAAHCPLCGTQVTKLVTGSEDIWVLKDEYAGMVGLPVGYEFGRKIPVRTFIHLEPCGHEVDKITMTKEH